MATKRRASRMPQRRSYDGSTGKMMAYGIGGGSVIGVLTTVFMFMNNAPWASKAELSQIKIEQTELKSELRSFTNSPDFTSNVRDMATIKATLASLQDSMREVKDDVKEIKDRPRK